MIHRASTPRLRVIRDLLTVDQTKIKQKHALPPGRQRIVKGHFLPLHQSAERLFLGDDTLECVKHLQPLKL